MEIHFHGATRTVTGSCHEIWAGNKKILLDCGLFQGPRLIAQKTNSTFQFDPTKIDAVVLSHGHTDHCGNLPNLIKQGYSGPIWCTPATAAVTALMLMDSAKIQEEDAAYLNQKTDKSWSGRIEPLYTIADAQKTIELFRPIPYRTPTEILPGVQVELRDTGHVLGSAAVSITELPTKKTLVFTGDVGRPNSPLLKDPDPFTHADALISECTYGGKTHAPLSQIPTTIAGIINETIARHGMIMVPAFALGRTQAMLEIIHILRDQHTIPDSLPVFVDSPLAMKLTELHRRFGELLDEETRRMLTPFDFPNLTYIQNTQESRALNERRDPLIVIAASGMCEGGRILHHLKHHIADARNTVLLPGYQAENTLGRRIQDHVHYVPILGDSIPLRAQVETLDGLSAHADGHELLQYVTPLKGAKVYLVHGEVPQAQAHAATLKSAGFGDATIPSRGDIVTV